MAAKSSEPAMAAPAKSEPAKKPALPDCRFYEAALPALGELVVVQIKKRLVDMGCSTYNALLEYNGTIGYVDGSEVSRRSASCASPSFARMRRIGHIEVCEVCKIDKKKGMIDLSKKSVNLGAAMEKEKEFAKAKLVHNVMRQVARKHNIDVEDLCQKITWPMYKNGGTAYEVLSQRLRDDDILPGLDFKQPGKDLSKLANRIKADIAQSLRRRLAPSVRVWAKIEVTCAQDAGILGIRDALTKGIAAGSDDCPVSIKLIAHPQFMVSATCHHRADGLQTMERVFEAIAGEMTSQGGTFFVRSRPMLEGPNQDEEEDYDSDEEYVVSEGEEAEEDGEGASSEAAEVARDEDG